MTLDSDTLAIVRFCAIECELQMSGERSVYWMVNGWAYAMGLDRYPTLGDVGVLGGLIEPKKNATGFRKVGVRVGWDIKLDFREVPNAMEHLIKMAPEAATDNQADEWFRQYEEVHPFVDGNGRTGAILFNWLNGTLEDPVWPPNYWDDPRRIEGAGA